MVHLMTLLLFSIGLAGLIWFGIDALPRIKIKQGKVTVENQDHWDLGPNLPAPTLVLLRVVAGVVIGLLIFLATHNVGATAVFGGIGSMTPILIMRRMNANRRALLDTQTYTLANSLRLLLPISSNVITALRDARDNAEEPLQSILSAALRTESRKTGGATDMIRDVGRDLNLTDMELLGDILLQVRTQTIRAGDLLNDLVALWGDRLQIEQRRLGKMSGSTRLGMIMILASMSIQVLWPAFDPSVRAIDGRLVGQVFGTIGALMTAGAFLIMDSATRKAMNAN